MGRYVYLSRQRGQLCRCSEFGLINGLGATAGVVVPPEIGQINCLSPGGRIGLLAIHIAYAFRASAPETTSSSSFVMAA